MRISPAVLQSPTRLSVAGFATLILFGTALLMLPPASTTENLGFVDALFTATSASCVTGLVVTDTGEAFTTFGQLTILGLIQVGGLGIMTLSTLFLLMARRRPSLAGRVIVQDMFTQGGDRKLSAILREVTLFSLVIEGLGMALIFLRFLPENGAIEAFYLSAFHAISAFCNAGFSLFSESFVAYREDWLLNLVICLLIILGGIGFPVLSEIKRNFPFNDQTWFRLSLHSKLVLSTTVTLLLFGTLLMFLMEMHNTLSDLSLPGHILAAFFQAVSARTAGFNTISIGNLANETLFVLILLMFVGGSPGSCAGGIKTTTLACLVVLGISRLRGQERPQLFRRTIAEANVGKAISVVMVSLVVVVTGTMILLMTEIGDVAHPLSRGKFLEFFFEVISAFGTVGLSTGVTGDLTTVGKLVLTVVMLLGRLGPLVVAMAVSYPVAPHYHYAEEKIMIG